MATIKEAVRQHELIIAERALLEGTLSGAVSVLTEVMSLTTPTAFSRSNALKSYVAHMCKMLGVTDSWQYELAATLTQLGCITLPPDTLEKLYAQQTLGVNELQMLEEHPQIGERLLSKIPRLEQVAEIIGLQHEPPSWNGKIPPESPQDIIAFGSNMLAVGLALDELVLAGKTAQEALKLLLKSKNLNSTLISTLSNFKGYEVEETLRSVFVQDLRTFMVLDEDIMSKSGHRIVQKGQEINQALLERLRNFSRGVGIQEPIRVRVKS